MSTEQHEILKMIKVINVRLLIFKMVSKRCFVYISYIWVYLVYLCFGFSFWMTNIYYWCRPLIPLTHAQNARVNLPSALVCAVCSSAAFWSDTTDKRRQHHPLSLHFWKIQKWKFSISGEQSSRSQQTRKKGGLIVLFPTAIRFTPAGHTPRSVSVPVISPFRSRSRYCWGTAAIEIARIAHGSGWRVVTCIPQILRSLSGFGKPALWFLPRFEWEPAAAAICFQRRLILFL